MVESSPITEDFLNPAVWPSDEVRARYIPAEVNHYSQYSIFLNISISQSF